MQLQEFLQKIEQESAQKCTVLRQHAENEMATERQTIAQQIEEKERAEKQTIEKQEQIAYEKRVAALKQDFRKQALRFRQTKIAEALGHVQQRLVSCAQAEFESFLAVGLQNLNGQGEYVITFGDQSPVDTWQAWAQAYMEGKGETRFNSNCLHAEVGFMIEQGRVSYRLLASEISEQLLQNKGAEFNQMLFEQEG